tara:strand:- start:298 stop:870 length:573 start_codon:yes stop_codon:yes gene_type:complete
MADLTSQIKVKRALGIPAAVTMHDDYIDTLIEVADQACLSYCGVAAFTQTSVTLEGHDIELHNQTEVVLRNFPVQSVSAVVQSGSTMSTDNYYLDQNTGAVRLIDGGSAFEQGAQTVKVSYTYGFNTIPHDLSHAATIIAVSFFNRTRHAGMRNEVAGGYSYRVENSGVAAAAKPLLARYVRVFPRDSQP